jgi:tungstate transport system permease protein
LLQSASAETVFGLLADGLTLSVSIALDMNAFTDSLLTAMALIRTWDPSLSSVVMRSLGVSTCACMIALVLGVSAGACLGVGRFRGQSLVVGVLNTLLALPSVVVGLVVYLLLSRSGPLGFLSWLFTFKAMVLAQTVLLLPLVTALTRQIVQDVEHDYGEQWQSLGAGPWLRAVLLAWDERHALATVAATAFGRAIAEVGAVMIVGGNIEGFTRVMTTSIALETSKGDLPLALGLGLVLLAVVGALHAVLGFWRWRSARRVQ